MATESEIFIIDTAKIMAGRKITTSEKYRRLIPQGILLKRGIRGGRFVNERKIKRLKRAMKIIVKTVE